MRRDRRNFMGLAGGGLFALALSREAKACIWDSDALELEAAGGPSIVPTLAGAFARNPPKYYEMRLARVTAALAAGPLVLEDYDDAGVSCDRLDRRDEAIEWMARKRDALEQLGPQRSSRTLGQPNHWYRYHANLGTFHAHRWLEHPERWTNMADLQRANELISKAIADNPNAHFGREIFQLRALAWLLGRPSYRASRGDSRAKLPMLLAELPPSQAMIAASGLCGLIILGAAWNSFDITLALSGVLARGRRPFLAELARQRCVEIVDAGGGSLVIGAPAGPALLELIAPAEPWAGPFRPELAPLREGAEAWAARREAYLMAGLDRGEHPDTTADFWSGFEDDPFWHPPTSLVLPYLYGDPYAEPPAGTKLVDKVGCGCASEDPASGGVLALGLGLGLLARRFRGRGEPR